MNIVIIHANPSEKSLGKEIIRSIIENLESKNIKPVFRDLYQINFDPVLTSDDLESFRTNKLSEDILTEQKIIANSDLLLFVYPLWWGGMPAIMKGYIDRVFAHGFAYHVEENGVFPGLKGKSVINICSHGESAEKFNEIGMYNALEKVFEEGVFKFSGIKTEAHFYFQDPWSMTDKMINDRIKEINSFIQNLVEQNN